MAMHPIMKQALEPFAPKDGATAEWQPIETAPKDGTEVLLWGVMRGHEHPQGSREMSSETAQFALLDADELYTIESIAKRGQSGRITEYEVTELVAGYRASSGMLDALTPFARLGEIILAEAPADAKTVVLFTSATGERFAVALDQFRVAIAAIAKATGGSHDKE